MTFKLEDLIFFRLIHAGEAEGDAELVQFLSGAVLQQDVQHP